MEGRRRRRRPGRRGRRRGGGAGMERGKGRGRRGGEHTRLLIYWNGGPGPGGWLLGRRLILFVSPLFFLFFFHLFSLLSPFLSLFFFFVSSFLLVSLCLIIFGCVDFLLVSVGDTAWVVSSVCSGCCFQAGVILGDGINALSEKKGAMLTLCFSRIRTCSRGRWVPP